MQSAGSFCITPDHPCLAGHFPQHPIVPGVMLLDQVFALILPTHTKQIVIGVPSVKFVQPVLPGQVVAVEWRGTATHRIAFTCTVASAIVLRGVLMVGRAA